MDKIKSIIELFLLNFNKLNSKKGNNTFIDPWRKIQNSLNLHNSL